MRAFCWRLLVFLATQDSWQSVQGPLGAAKRWGSSVYGAADKLAAEFGLGVVVVGSVGERSISESICRAMKQPAIILNGKTSLETLIGLIAESSLLLKRLGAGSSGGGFGDTDSRRVRRHRHIVAAPYSPRGRAVREPVECSPCWRECPIDHRCMTRITPEMVRGGKGSFIVSVVIEGVDELG
jgi:heptosyltransferase-2